MRAIYMPSLFTRYEPDLEYIRKTLPDVTQMEIVFPELSMDGRFDPHLAKDCNFTFNNGRTLNVPGVMLWKFLDMIPDALGTEATGYFDHNMFTADYGENLMRRIRAAYQASFVNTPRKGMPSPPPIRAVFNLKTGRNEVLWMKKLSDASVKYLSAAYIDSLGSSDISEIEHKIAAFVRQETSEEQFELGFKDLGNGRLGRTKIRKPWPDLAQMTFETFLKGTSAKTMNDCPAQRSQLDLFSEVILLANVGPTLRFLRWLRETDGYDKIAKEVGCTSPKPLVKTFLKHLQASEHCFIFIDCLWSHFYGRMKALSVKDVIARD